MTPEKISETEVLLLQLALQRIKTAEAEARAAEVSLALARQGFAGVRAELERRYTLTNKDRLSLDTGEIMRGIKISEAAEK